MGANCCNNKDASLLGKKDEDFTTNPNENLENKSLYELLGGEAAIEIAVDKFYDKVLSDPIVKDFFKNTNMKFQKKHQKNFLSFATGGPNNYDGKNMKDAHKHLNLTDTHFNQIKIHLANTLFELGVKESFVNSVSSLVETLRKDILSR